MHRTKSVIAAAVLFLLATAACGYDVGTTFGSDGSVTVNLKFLFPKSLMQGTAGASVQGMSPAEITKANGQLAGKYPGAKVATVSEGDEMGAQITIPFKNEKDAFAFLTQPSQLNPSSAASGSSSIDLSNTGGVFVSATHTTSGQDDTYTFKTQPTPLPSPSPGSQSPITGDELSSLFSITFSLTLPHEITSAPGALFTLDRKTAIWKMSLTQAQTMTATSGPGVALAGFATGGTSGQSAFPAVGIGLVALVIGLALGMLQPWRRLRSAGAIAPPMPPPGDLAGPPTGPPATPPPWPPASPP